ncbi:GTPase [Xanthobacter sp.]|uniref:GTPase n=1 Tax=Xanthobacter sp. TaxID=35809 RepID=UPI0025D05A82|nr:GTPase [Xanthobacter sp.]
MPDASLRQPPTRAHPARWHDVLCVLPHRDGDLARLDELAAADAPVVTVIGKYNHGKSRLLNELMRQNAFAVADRRQTVQAAECRHAGVRWLDAPGLDADVAEEDDRHALRAVWLSSDIRLFVHAAREGELDAAEQALLAALRSDSQRTRRETLIVVTQADQMEDDDALSRVMSAIADQVPGADVHVVSSTRHRRGLEDGKTLLIKRSGIPELERALADAIARVPAARAHETRLLLGVIRAELESVRRAAAETLASLRQQQEAQRHAFDDGLKALLAAIGRDMEEVVALPGPDLALVADTGRERYATTAAKLERARIQVAYSRACIRLDGFLAGHGVSRLPQEQQTASGSLNTVMVAVMGVSVKFRADLRRMFCEAPGRARLQAAFAHYFELSRSRAVLRDRITEAAAALDATDRALAALPPDAAP